MNAPIDKNFNKKLAIMNGIKHKVVWIAASINFAQLVEEALDKWVNEGWEFIDFTDHSAGSVLIFRKYN